MKRTGLKLLTLLTCLLLASCAGLRPSVPPSNQSLAWQQRQAQLQKINNWHLSGSVSIQHQNKTDLASITWNQTSNHYDIVLSGPLSLGRVEIIGRPGLVTLVSTRQKSASASSPEMLMQQQLGWQIPISSLYYWVRGLPTPGIPSNTKFDRYNHIIKLAQQGWYIEYLDFTQTHQVDLPRTISLRNPQLQVRLIIREWNISP